MSDPLLYYASFDIDDIIKGIRNGYVKGEDIKYIFSKSVQPLGLLETFPNVEKIHCPLLCTSANIHKVSTLIGNCQRLRKIILNILLPSPDEEEEENKEHANKKEKNREEIENFLLMNLYKFVQENLYSIICGLGRRLETLNISFNICDDIIGNTIINIDHGYYYTNRESLFQNLIYNLLIDFRVCRGLVTNGSFVYQNTSLYEIILIVDENFNNTYPSAEIISSAKIISTKYIGKGIIHYGKYANYLLENKGCCTRLRTIVPLDTVDTFLKLYPNLHEIHVLCDDNDKSDVLQSIVTKNPDIYYHVYTCGNFDSTPLLNIGDIKFTPLVYYLYSTIF